jgi:hypothetical protein
MYLYLGQNVVTQEESVIGIFDLDNTTWSHITRKFLSQAEKAGSVITVSDELPKSFVVCGESENLEIYLSQLSPATLAQRAQRFA